MCSYQLLDTLANVTIRTEIIWNSQISAGVQHERLELCQKETYWVKEAVHVGRLVTDIWWRLPEDFCSQHRV